MHDNASDGLWAQCTDLPSHPDVAFKMTFACVCLMGADASVIVTLCQHRSAYKKRGEKTEIPLTYKKTKPDGRWSDQLVNQNLLGHGFHGLARVGSVQPLVPVVHTGTQSGAHSKHATFRDTEERSIHVNHSIQVEIPRDSCTSLSQALPVGRTIELVWVCNPHFFPT